MPPAAAVAGGFVLTAVAGLLDYLTGPEFAPLTLYLLPVAIVAWAGARWQGAVCAVAAGSSWAVSEGLTGDGYDTGWLFVWASLTRVVVLLTIALLLHRARSGPGPEVAGTQPCPHCASTETVPMRMGLVCRDCKRLS